ncbi:ATP-grasp domain-containing protein [Phaeodactylibacter luteus]|uniref:Glutathione synthetase n=1 Tax=Phaeodactylibacter luteus TaxID=1564516 RepID=A0A5C6S6U7_9BACT|nr:glutathione synthetase [Phaeodactylibacter luteus]TXB70220.1 glutathione synthetase [Phaeodactylibacter luteus]
MKNDLSVLVLTDHRNHSEHNSVYALCSELRKLPGISSIHVASRGNPANDGFFYHFSTTSVRAWSLEGEMAFQHGPYRFMQETVPADIREYDWVWLRLPYPIPDGFFAFLRNTIDEQRIFNRPSGIEATSSKAFLTQWPQLSPDTRLCQNMSDVMDMQSAFPIVLKPLHSYGGQGILRIKDGRVMDNRRYRPLEAYRHVLETGFGQGGYLGMRYLRNVRKGDKRVIVINGQILGAVLRIPPKGSWLCNAAQGGQAVLSQADEREQWMVKELSRALLPLGIVMFGMDTLVDDEGLRVLSEVNTLSIGGVKPLEDLSGQPLVRTAAQGLLQYMNRNTPAPTANTPVFKGPAAYAQPELLFRATFS